MTQKTNVLISMAMILIISLFMIVSSHCVVIAETEEDLCGMEIHSNNAPFIEDLATTPSPLWFSYELVCDAGDDYSGYSRTEKPIYYPDGSIQFPINSEKFAIYATDQAGVEQKLSPVDNLLSGNNINAMGSVTLRIVELNTYAPTASNHNDIKLFNAIDNDIRPTNASGYVGYGKIIYRHVDRGQGEWSRSDWHHVNLADAITLTIPANKHVQIVLIHEVEETGKWYQLNYFTELKGIYRFDTYPA